MAHRLKDIIHGLLPPYALALIRRRRPLPAAFVESDRNVRGDEYLEWIQFIVGGFLFPGNVRAFDHAMLRMPTLGAIVEIGSLFGLSTNIIAYLATKYRRPNPLFACDPWTPEGSDGRVAGYFDAHAKPYREYSKTLFMMNARLFSKDRLPYAIETFSEVFFEQWRTAASVQDVFGRTVTLGGPISFAYIDGAHTYEASRADFEAVDRHLLPGGFVLLDDSGDDCPFESRRVAQEVAHDVRYDLVFTTPNYFFRRKTSRAD